MSVLSFPRIYFNGYMGWDVSTANNNDYLPIYDAANAELNWDYLATQGITRENFRDKFRGWDINAHTDFGPLPEPPNPPTPDTCTSCGGGGQAAADTCHMGSRWGYYGSAGCSFVDYKNYQTRVTGGAPAFSQSADPQDAILNAPVEILGNTFGGRSSPARLVDTNPQSPFCSQIFFNSFRIGKFLSGLPTSRMYSRSFFVPRNLDSSLIIAGAIGVIFQTTFALDQLDVGDTSSPLLNALIKAAQGAKGIMWRFAAYDTLYYQNGTFNDFPIAPNCDAVHKAYEALQEGQLFMNPAYSSVTGVFGVWNEGELETAPGGRHLVADQQAAYPSQPGGGQLAATQQVVALRVSGGSASLSIQRAPAAQATASQPTAPQVAAAASGGPPPMLLGSAWADIDLPGGYVSLDLLNAIRSNTPASPKLDYGPLQVGLCDHDNPSGTFTPLGTIPFKPKPNQPLVGYNQDAYLDTAGIVDLPFAGISAADVQTLLQKGQVLAIRRVDQDNAVVFLERLLTAETDDRGVYIDEGGTAQLTIQVRHRGGLELPPNTTLKVRLAQYYPWPLDYGAGEWIYAGNPAASGTPQYVKFQEGEIVDVDTNGNATVTLEYVSAGFPIIVFYPFLSSQPVPTPLPTMTFTPQPTPMSPRPEYLIGDSYYATVRALGADDNLKQEFVDSWNLGDPPYDATRAWQFVYYRILYVYDMLYPVMDALVPLGNRTRVEGAIDQLLVMIQEPWVTDSTLYMPITRELSAGKRWVLQAWGKLVKEGFPTRPIRVDEVFDSVG